MKLLCFRKELEVREMPGRLLRVEQVLGRDKGFTSRDRVYFWFCVMTGVPSVAILFLGFMQLLCRDIVLPCHDNALLIYRDNVMTEVSLSRPRRSEQEVRCCNGFDLGRELFFMIE